MDSILKWFNGKKSIIGGIALWLVAGMDLFGLDGDTALKIVSVLQWIGTVMFPVGLAHKVIKNEVANPSPK